MRSRSNSGVRLDFYQRTIHKTILKYQNPVTGLLPAAPNHQHAWVRDNVYSILAVWGLALAYRKHADLDEDRAKAYELEQSVVKLMRGLLACMMKQMDKVERFKYTQSPKDALHAKYSVTTGSIVVGDSEWGHLQIDATSVYLLILAEMIASGLQIIYTLDEVAFIQNLVFYIQIAYRTPDFGIWERGDKTNHGVTELNLTSIGMAKAALEALNDLDLFGARGGPSSVINVIPDEAEQCQAILNSVLPRESNSKETDAGLLSVIGYPAFAVDNQELIDLTRQTVLDKLQGRYGLCRFLRDGYKTPREDPNRLYYDPCELQGFENIECEWPLFYAYLVLFGLFNGDKEQVDEYSEALDEIMIKREDGITLMPELYAVPSDKVEAESRNPKSQDRIATGKMPQMWGQSLYVLGRLLKEGFLSPGEIDPLNRRLTAEPKPDIVVQVVIVAEDQHIQEKLATLDLHAQTAQQIHPIQIYPARILSQLFSHLGRCQKLGLTGRPADMVGVLATSKVYTLGNQTLAFFPQFVDQQQFYLPLDIALLLDMFQTDVQFLGKSWKMLGRPVIVFRIEHTMLDMDDCLHPALLTTIKKLQTGYINATRVHLGNLSDFLNTSCVTNLTFLTQTEDAPDLASMLQSLYEMASASQTGSHLLGCNKGVSGASMPITSQSHRRKSMVSGIIRRTCSIAVSTPGDISSDCSVSPMSATPPPSPMSPFFNPSYQSQGSGRTSPSTSPLSSRVTAESQCDLPAPSEHPHLRGANREGAAISAYHDQQYEGVDCHELIIQLNETEILHEQADIIHYLVITKGYDWETDEHGCTVKCLLSELYEKAGMAHQWWLVRHTAGMLHKQVDGLAKAQTDILIRQKQLAVGLPPEPREKIITRPLPPDELAAIIHEACGEDSSTAMLTQELLVYLAMFIRTEPKLFHEMLRLRVGLIIQVMASELARAHKCSGEEASDQLLNLSPYETKSLLHHILSGKEFTITTGGTVCYDSVESKDFPLSLRSTEGSSDSRPSSVPYKFSAAAKTVRVLTALPMGSKKAASIKLHSSLGGDRQGQWLRRRRLDGALNRVPVGFYQEIWQVLRRCHGLSIEGLLLPRNLTSEMTPGEMKFALQVELVLNRIPQPEYRQLMVEAMMVLVLIVQHDGGATYWNQEIYVDQLVRRANEIFIEEQSLMDGDVTLCCGAPRVALPPGQTACGGAAGVCLLFYDVAPSGRYGTLSYLCRAAADMLHFPVTSDGNFDCPVQ